MNQLFLQIEERIKQVKHFHDDGEVAGWLGLKKSNYSRRKARNSIPYEQISGACARDGLSYDFVMFETGNPFEHGEDSLPGGNPGGMPKVSGAGGKKKGGNDTVEGWKIAYALMKEKYEKLEAEYLRLTTGDYDRRVRGGD